MSRRHFLESIYQFFSRATVLAGRGEAGPWAIISYIIKTNKTKCPHTCKIIKIPGTLYIDLGSRVCEWQFKI